MLASIALGFWGSFIPLLKPTQSNCTLEYAIVVISSTLIMVNLLWKCIKIHAIFAEAYSRQLPKFLIALDQVGQVLLNSVTIAFVCVFLLIDKFGTGPGWKFDNKQEDDHGPIYLKCELTDGYRLIIAIFPMILPLLYLLHSLTFAFKMRKFPHNYQETQNILTATLIVAFCVVMFLSGYSIAPPETRALLRSVVLYAANLAFLICLFLPKVCLLYTSPSPRDQRGSRMPSSA